MVAAAGALEMTGGQRAELERLARSLTAPAREVRQAKGVVVGRRGGNRCGGARKSREPGLHDAAGSG